MQAATGPILALGAFLKNRLCYFDGAALHWSVEHGDLSSLSACQALRASVEAGRAQGWRPQLIVHDAHPQFYSTELALEWAHQWQVPSLAVQHHHAHLGAVCAEYGINASAGPVYGWLLDGVGYGTDGQAWGGELLRVEGAHMVRLAHLQKLVLAGGDKAAQQPWRMALAVCQAADSWEHVDELNGPPEIQAQLVASVRAGVWDDKPHTTAAGRWFDAVAALLGVAPATQTEAQAAILLEACAQKALNDGAPAALADWPSPTDTGADIAVPLAPWVMALSQAVRARGKGAATLEQAQNQAALVFHWGLADVLVARLLKVLAADRSAGGAENAPTVVLNGGCFFNQILQRRMVEGLARVGIKALVPQAYSCGDAALALGQIWVGAARG